MRHQRDLHPAEVSADGRWLAFYLCAIGASVSTDCNQIAVVPASGGAPTLLGTGPLNQGWLQWSPSGATLAYVDGVGRDAAHNKQVRLASMPSVDPSQPGTPALHPGRSLTPASRADRDPAWAPDGQYLAITRSTGPWQRMDEPAAGQAIWTVDTQTGKSRRVPGSAGGATPFWTQDGALFWVKPYHQRGDLYYLPPGARRPVRLIENLSPLSSYYGQWNSLMMLDWWAPPNTQQTPYD